MTNYKPTSPYFQTAARGQYLDIMENRPIPKLEDDKLFRITQTYQYRPDLLAFDLYGSAELWWVFAQRNPNTISDPIWDFKIGTPVFLPKLSTLRTALGI